MIRSQNAKSLYSELTSQDFSNWPLYCTANIDLKNQYKVINAILPSLPTDLASKAYIDSKFPVGTS